VVRWLAIMVVLGLAPSTAQGLDMQRGPSAQPSHSAAPRVNFRIVQDNLYQSRSSHRSGMIASTDVAPGTTVGVGIIKTPSRRSNAAGDWRLDSRGAVSRRAAVTFQFRF